MLPSFDRPSCVGYSSALYESENTPAGEGWPPRKTRVAPACALNYPEHRNSSDAKDRPESRENVGSRHSHSFTLSGACTSFHFRSRLGVG